MPVWSPFGGKLTAPPPLFDPRWSMFDRVRHVTHTTLAQRIVEDRTIAPGLVGEGCLAATRRLVAWVSPNTWGPGARYGSVEFTFDWLPLLGTRSLLWVEPIKYNLQTVRFLLTDKPADWLALGLLPYDPAVDDGPVQLFGGKWYRRHDIVVEIMTDGEIPLSACLELGFVDHHPKFCSLGRSNCIEATQTPRTKARILGHILGTGLHGADHALVSADNMIGGLNAAVSDLWFSLRFKDCAGPITAPDEAKALMRSAALLAGQGEFDAAKQVVHLIGSQALGEQTLLDLVRDHFGNPNLKLD
jgi:hypothetical protein